MPLQHDGVYDLYNQRYNDEDLFIEDRTFANLFNAYAKAINKAYGRWGRGLNGPFGALG